VLLAPQWHSSGGVDEGAIAVASKRSRHGGGGDDNRVPTAIACTPVASLMAVRWRQRAREMKVGK
jgi:hypothetical protein